MTTVIQNLPTPPTPADTPTEFNSKAFSLLGALPNFVTQANALGGEMTVLGANADTDAQAAAASATAAGQSATAAAGSANAAGNSAGQAAGSAGAANQSKLDAQAAAQTATNIAGGMEAAIAMAQTFTSVPSTFQAWEIIVTQPHLRKMIWNSTQGKYVRAPWHQPCQLFYSYDNPVSIPGALPVRSDASWNQADFPDVIERLGLSGTGTFTLAEARGEFLRVLDNGRGVDVGRAVRTNQSAILSHYHKLPTGTEPGNQYAFGAEDGSPNWGSEVVNGVASSQSWTMDWIPKNARIAYTSPEVISGDVAPRNVAFPLWMTI